MKKKYLLIALILLVLMVFVLANYLVNSRQESQNTRTITLGKGDKELKVEIADEPYEHARGLMFRESMKDDEGMLFIFSDSEYRTFWMKNTLIPLDIIFIDGDSQIVDITTMQPCEKEPCETYTSSGPAKYVLEVNAGFAEKNGLKAGDSVF
ncbi:MAG TPA: DUF192 domain-containing protein [Nanoarchaeota archaeon]|nr:DUF192 domain-containing protein [Nanoarchaeota archaeon]HIH33835.1 DUF192 domain-containing protein [Nanoarchaeota archaeon]HIH50778.1 DUF192 domain-containing protein [Nanoarchaeota archaeon]HIH65814.1 DUF192 domain-containing protein [Nanoarchaeota archaeon]